MNTMLLLADVSVLEDEDLFGTLLRRLPSARREKALRYRFAKDRNLSVGVGILLEEALRRAGVKESPGLAEGPGGKPYYVNQKGICFNLSHSGTMALCALGPWEAGCDIEERRTKARLAAERFLNPDERVWLDGARDEEERERMFFRLWTLKESFMKVTGRGFSLRLEDFSVVPQEDGIVLRQDVDGRAYAFREYDAVPGYALSLCLAEAPEEAWPEEPERVDLRTLAI